MLDDPPNMIDLINYVFCSSQSLCSNHSMWPFVAFYVPEVHGDIPPSLMVLFSPEEAAAAWIEIQVRFFPLQVQSVKKKK